MLRALLLHCSLCSLPLVAPQIHAAWLNAGDLRRHCDEFLSDAQSTQAAICAAFIEGFVASTRLMDSAIAASSRPRGTFTERAARTRVGSRLGRPSDGEYCIDRAVPAAAVVGTVAARLRARSSESDDAPRRDEAPAARAVHDVLVATFPCDDP